MTNSNTSDTPNASGISDFLEVAETYLVGRLGGTPEVREVTVRGDSKTVANVSIAATKLGRKNADGEYPDAVSYWVRLSAWNGSAEHLMKFDKGDLVKVRVGSVKLDKWLDDDNQEHRRVSATVAYIEKMGGGSGSGSASSRDLDDDFEASFGDVDEVVDAPAPKAKAKAAPAADDADEDGEPTPRRARRTRRRQEPAAA